MWPSSSCLFLLFPDSPNPFFFCLKIKIVWTGFILQAIFNFFNYAKLEMVVKGNSSRSNNSKGMIKSFDLSRVFNKVSHFVQFVSFHPTLIHLSVFVSLTHLSLFLLSICLSICPSIWLSLCLDFGTLQTCHTVLSITCFVSFS